MSLKQYSEDELQAELNRRASERMLVNSIRVAIDDTPVDDIKKRIVSLAESYLKDELDGDEIDEHWAYELVMTLAYGNDIWRKINTIRA